MQWSHSLERKIILVLQSGHGYDIIASMGRKNTLTALNNICVIIYWLEEMFKYDVKEHSLEHAYSTIWWAGGT